MLVEEAGHDRGVLHVGGHPQRQRLQAQQEQERVERGHRGADVAQLLGPQPREEAVLGEVAPPRQVAVGGHRLRHQREAAVGPVEPAGLDDDAADGRAVAAEELRRRVHDDVGPELHRPAEVGRRQGGVHDEGHAVAVGDGGQPLEVGDRPRRVADDLGVHRLVSAASARRRRPRRRRRRRTSSRCRTAAASRRAASACRRRAGTRRRCGRPRRPGAIMTRSSAAWPLEVATAPRPPSRLAMRSSNAATVGLAMRL